MDMNIQQHEENEIELRNSFERPIYKLSVKLIDTYKYINKVYYESKAEKLKDKKDSNRIGIHNDGYDDQNYDYIVQGDEILQDRYVLKHKMGKGSFGQVICAYDREKKVEVAIKIIKSKKPFQLQAQTEIDILNKIKEKDHVEDSNIVMLLDHFMYRNHQCLVFEILSFNLYELLKNTKFRGVSLNLIRKFSKHLLKSLEFLSRPDVDIIHCDLKPENILLRHPRRSAIKLIDFGSSCYLNKRTYSYIQSRFYRAPEILLGLPYTQKIDMWSLGCVLVELHTGEPLFGGSNQNDQLCRIVDILGMPPIEMIKASPEKVRPTYFERVLSDVDLSTLSSSCDLNCMVHEEDLSAAYILKRPNRDIPKPRTLEEILGVYTGGPNGRRTGEVDHTPPKYLEFIEFIKSLLVYSPILRASATQSFYHPYMLNDTITTTTTSSTIQPQNYNQPTLSQSSLQSPSSSQQPQQSINLSNTKVNSNINNTSSNNTIHNNTNTIVMNHSHTQIIPGSSIRSKSAPSGTITTAVSLQDTTTPVGYNPNPNTYHSSIQITTSNNNKNKIGNQKNNENIHQIDMFIPPLNTYNTDCNS